MKTVRVTKIVEEIDENGSVTELSREVDDYIGSFYFCANYLIQCFYKTGQRYTCTRIKTGKILSILAFKYACKGEKKFIEPIYRYPNCGTWIRSTALLFQEEYVNYFSEDDKKEIYISELRKEVEIPWWCRNIVGVSDDLKRDIEEVFCYFGAYSQTDLSELLNPIVEHEGICRPDGSIDLEAIANLDKNQFPGNKVVEYMFS